VAPLLLRAPSQPPLAPSRAHRLAARLADEGRLLRVVTQNVDGLEEAAGVPAARVLRAHGSLAEAACTRAGCPAARGVGVEAVLAAALRGRVPLCAEPRGTNKRERAAVGRAMAAAEAAAAEAAAAAAAAAASTAAGAGAGADAGAGASAGGGDVAPPATQPAGGKTLLTRGGRRVKRRAYAEDFDEDVDEGNGAGCGAGGGGDAAADAGGGPDAADAHLPPLRPQVPGACGAVMRPGVVLFGEALPRGALAQMRLDAAAADLLLVIGTSLRVRPVSELPALVRGAPRVLINREPLEARGAAAAGAAFDLELIGDADVVAELLERRAFGGGGGDGDIVVQARDAAAPRRLHIAWRGE